ncbi:hypothetical protein SH661x_000941 [Planctomicrobium sp. SH661]|uniref:hypothetical protein n=1 Tax=Planctomicrobium sp. SH661 TaxID=3448124 RepID=UPI003F5ADF1C
MSWEEFLALPRHPAYRYEYRNGHLQITGNPRFAHCTLSLAHDAPFLNLEPAGTALTCFFSEYERRAADKEDWAKLPALFTQAFQKSPPLMLLSDEQRTEAANTLLKRTHSSEDGPIVAPASLVLADRETGELQAAILITLIPAGDVHDFTHHAWTETPPDDAVANRWGQPHLTWIFVSPEKQRRGLGEVLLRESVSVLKRLGYSQLVSTFLVGDVASPLWHWKHGFELASYPGSPKRLVDE